MRILDRAVRVCEHELFLPLKREPAITDSPYKVVIVFMLWVIRTYGIAWGQTGRTEERAPVAGAATRGAIKASLPRTKLLLPPDRRRRSKVSARLGSGWARSRFLRRSARIFLVRQGSSAVTGARKIGPRIAGKF
jgi:hypothetical protein